MSEVIIDKITGNAVAGNIEVTSEGGAATFQMQQGLAKAWASFDQGSAGHPVYADSSLNTSSTTDISAGVTKISFINNFSNATYAISGTTQTQDTGGTYFGVWGYSTTSSRQTTSSNFHTDFRDGANSSIDSRYTAYKVLGDLL